MNVPPMPGVSARVRPTGITWNGTPVLVSDALPYLPSPGEDGRRTVRHGLAEVLRWLGEEVGPAPGEGQHVYLMSDHTADGRFAYLMSPEFAEKVRSAADDQR